MISFLFRYLAVEWEDHEVRCAFCKTRSDGLASLFLVHEEREWEEHGARCDFKFKTHLDDFASHIR